MATDIYTCPIRSIQGKILLESHKERMKNIKSTIDTSAPPPHPLPNKKIQNVIARSREIERENYLLLQRLARIVQTPSIDTHISKHVKEQQEFKKRLSYVRRFREKVRIAQENASLLERILLIKPSEIHKYKTSNHALLTE